MDKPLVSVTVPIYNTSKYLKKCLDSLSAQTLKDIEFILIDDGSTDDSGSICDAYAKTDSRFTVIHQKNGGSSVARETGLQNSRGEYIIICDSDDWVEPDMYERMYDTAKKENADIVTCGYFSEYDNNRQSNKYIKFIENDGVVDNYDLLLRGSGWSSTKLIKRSIFEKFDIHYECGINLSEDSLILYKLMNTNPIIVQIDKPFYHYRRIFGGSSQTNNLSMQHIHQLEYTYNWLKEHYCTKKWQYLVNKRAIDTAFACLRVKDLNKKYYRDFLKTELPWNTIFEFRTSLKAFVIASSKLLPISFVRVIVKYLYRFVYS